MGMFEGIKKMIAAKGEADNSGPVTKPMRRRGGKGAKTLPNTRGTKGPKDAKPGRRKRGLKMLKSRFGHNDSGGY